MLSNKLLLSLYFQILRIRRVEEAIADCYKEQEMRCPVHLSIGQEAIAAGVCKHLKKSDIVFSNHRSHGHYLAKGGSLPAMIAEIYGKDTGCSKGRGGSQHLIDMKAGFWGSTPIVASTVPLSVGSAFYSKLKKDKKITVVFLGDAAMEEGVTHESLNFASLHKLPIFFVCENNFYSISTHINERQPVRKIADLAGGHGILSWQEDGNDFLRIYSSSLKAISLLREDKGPVFVEFQTYRYREHVGPNIDKEGFRPPDEYKFWIKKDPLKRAQNYLINQMILTDQVIQKYEEKIKKEIEVAFEFAKSSRFPNFLSEKQAYA